jgi:DNA-binding XRE family transcriptional regulator
MTSSPLSAEILGERLRAARSGVNLTQEAAGASLGMARTTLVAVEKGLRPVRLDELLAFARLHGVSVGKLTAPDAIHLDIAAKFRRAEGRDAPRASTQSLGLLNRLATGAAQLERLLGQELRTDYRPPVLLNGSKRQSTGRGRRGESARATRRRGRADPGLDQLAGARARPADFFPDRCRRLFPAFTPTIWRSAGAFSSIRTISGNGGFRPPFMRPAISFPTDRTRTYPKGRRTRHQSGSASQNALAQPS